MKVKITIRSDQIPIILTIQGSDESADKLVEVAKKFLRMKKFWHAEGQMSFDRSEENGKTD